MLSKRDFSIALSLALATGTSAAFAVAEEPAMSDATAEVRAATSAEGSAEGVVSAEEAVTPVGEAALEEAIPEEVATPIEETVVDAVATLAGEVAPAAEAAGVTSDLTAEGIVVASESEAATSGAIGDFTWQQIELESNELEYDESTHIRTGLKMMTGAEVVWEAAEGKSADVVVPAQAGGMPVVKVTVRGDAASVDFSACRSTLLSVSIEDNAVIRQIDLSGCSELNTYSIYTDGPLESVSFAGCVHLYTMRWQDAPAKLDLSGCERLVALICEEGGGLTELDVSGCAELIQIDVSGNDLTSLDLSGLEMPGISEVGPGVLGDYIHSLDVSDCALTSLKLPSEGTGFYFIDCSGNQLTGLDVSGQPSLNQLDCSFNLLTSLDVSACANLTTLDCSHNRISDTSALEAWTEESGHEGVILPQDASESAPATEDDDAGATLPQDAPESTPASFTDVPDGQWYTDWVAKAAAAGLMAGTKDESGAYTGEFAPESTLTRAQVATVLYRLGTDETGDADVPETTSFSDTGGHWAAGAIEWCYERGVVTGDAGKGTFRPDDPVSRQELAAMVGRYAEKVAGIDVSKADDANYGACIDAGKEDSYATAYLKWTAAEGILSGKEIDGGKVIDATDGATRAQAAKVFVVLLGVVG